MPTEIATFSDLDSVAIMDAAELLADMLSNALPSLNTSRGSMIWETFIYPAAVGQVYLGAPLDTLTASWNLADVAADPSAADDNIVDALLSNYNATRSAGTSATGQVELILTAAHAITVTPGTLFTAGSVVFTNTTAQVVIVQESDRTSDLDRVLITRTDGTFSVKVDVTAIVPGVAGNVTYGTSFTVSPRPTYLSNAKAAEDMSGGSEPDTNADVVALAAQGLTARILSSSSGAKALLMGLVPSSTAASVIGAQSPELTRDQRSLLGTSNGGRADVLLRTQSTIETAMVVKTGTVVDANSKTYSIALDRDDMAGGYDLVSIIAQGDQMERSLAPITETWGYDVSNLIITPDIVSTAEAAFSRYQTLTVTFIDITDTGTYEVRFRRLPSIDTAQGYCMHPDYRDPLADWLVRAPIPAITQIELNVMVPAGVTADTTTIIAAAVDAVNANSFVPELSASKIVKAVSSVLPTGAYLDMPIGMDATIIYPDRVKHYIRSGNTLTVPTVYASGVSKNTVAFFASTDTVDVTTEVI